MSEAVGIESLVPINLFINGFTANLFMLFFMLFNQDLRT